MYHISVNGNLHYLLDSMMDRTFYENLDAMTTSHLTQFSFATRNIQSRGQR